MLGRAEGIKVVYLAIVEVTEVLKRGCVKLTGVNKLEVACG